MVTSIQKLYISQIYFLILFACLHLSGQSRENVLIQHDIHTFFFDYRIEYSYSTPMIPNGEIVAFYNSKDHYVMYSNITPFMSDETALIVFMDGSAILFTDSEARKKAVYYPPVLADRKAEQPYNVEKTSVFWSSLERQEKDLDIAGYEAIEYTGTWRDDNFRTLRISNESFDARALHVPLSQGINFLPLPLTEAFYIGPDQFLLSSHIALDNGNSYHLMTQYLEYELHMIGFPDFEWIFTSNQTSLAYEYRYYKSKLREEKFEVWQNYERMSGLEYEPRSYDFDERLSYLVQIGEFRGDLVVWFNTKREFALLESSLFTDGLKAILAFKDGTMIGYYSKEDKDQIDEAIYVEPAGYSLHLEHPQYVRWTSEYFNQKWENGGKTNKNGFNCQSYHWEKGTEWSSELCLLPVNFDPRAILLDFDKFLGGTQDIFGQGKIIPPGQIIVSLKEGSDFFILLQDRKQNTYKEFSDTYVPRFSKLKGK